MKGLRSGRRSEHIAAALVTFLFSGQLLAPFASPANYGREVALAGVPPVGDRLLLLGGILIALAVLGLMLNALRRQADSRQKEP